MWAAVAGAGWVWCEATARQAMEAFAINLLCLLCGVANAHPFRNFLLVNVPGQRGQDKAEKERKAGQVLVVGLGGVLGSDGGRKGKGPCSLSGMDETHSSRYRSEKESKSWVLWKDMENVVSVFGLFLFFVRFLLWL